MEKYTVETTPCYSLYIAKLFGFSKLNLRDGEAFDYCHE